MKIAKVIVTLSEQGFKSSVYEFDCAEKKTVYVVKFDSGNNSTRHIPKSRIGAIATDAPKGQYHGACWCHPSEISETKDKIIAKLSKYVIQDKERIQKLLNFIQQ